MSDLLNKLPSNRRRGSKPRCHWITHGTAEAVSERLTALMAPYGSVSATDHWMPEGFDQTDEAEFHKACRLLREGDCATLKAWWFKIARGGKQKSPNFDIASTCTVTVGGESQPGLLLIEAKAHGQELHKEAAGKPQKDIPSDGQKTNHDHIGEAIQLTNAELGSLTGLPWTLSHKTCYQMSCRFAWSFKLLGLGYPVVLVYLGFLHADEMHDQGQPLASPAEWRDLVRSHGKPVVPEAAWDRPSGKGRKTLVPLIRSVQVPCDRPAEEFIVT